MASIHRSLWFRLLLLTFLSSLASAQLVPSGDTYVTGASPTTANGSSTSIVVQGSSVGKPSLTYIRFDLTPLGSISSAQIKSAYLRVYVTAVTAAGGVDVYEVTTSPNAWAEGTLTFNTTGASSPVTGAQLGTTISVPYPSGKSMYFDVDVTAALKDWITSGVNNGLVLKPHDTSVSVSFSSKEDTTFSQVPQIVVNLQPGASSLVTSVSAGPGIGVTPLSGTGDVNVANTGVIGVSGTAGQINASSSTGNVILSLNNPINVNTTGTAASITGNIPESQVTSLTSDLAGKLTATSPLNAANLSGTIPPGNLSGTYAINISGSAANALFATSAGNANTANTATTATNSSQLGGINSSSYARLDIANLFNGNQSISGGQLTLAPSAAGYAALNFPSSANPPSPPHPGDLWFITGNIHPQFRDNAGTPLTHSLAFTDDPVSSAQISGSYGNSVSFTNPANTFYGNGANLTSLNATQLTSGTVPSTVISGTYGNVLNFSNPGNMFTGTFSGDGTNVSNVNAARLGGLMPSAYALLGQNANFAALTASTFSGDGSAITNLNATNLASGTVDDARLSNNVALITRSNIFQAGQKQIFTSDSNYAGLNIAGVTADPTAHPLTAGDFWFRSDLKHLQLFDGTGTRQLAFSDDTLSNAQLTGTYTNAVTLNNPTNMFYGNGANLTSLNATQLTSGTVPSTVISGTYGNVLNLSNPGNMFTGTFSGDGTNVSNVNAAMLGGQIPSAYALLAAPSNTFTGPVTAASFSGAGTNLTALNASNLASGTVDDARLSGNVALDNHANVFSATQALAPKGAPSQPSNAFQLNANDSSSVSQTAQLQARPDGALSFQFGPTAGPITEKASIDKNGVFTGNGSGLTNISGANVTNIPNSALQFSSVNINTGTGLSGGGNVALGGTLNLANTGVTSFNGSAGAVTGVSVVTAGNTGISIGGTAEMPTIANAGVLSFNGNTGNVLAVFPVSTPAVTHQFFTAYNAGSGAFTQVQPSFADLTGTDSATTHLVYNNQDNAYGLGNKQTFKASSTVAGVNVFGVATDPTGPLAGGDLWFNTGSAHLRFFDGSNTHSLMFTDDQIQNAQLANNSITVSAGTGLSGGGSVALGGSTTLNNAGVLSNIAGTGISVSGATGNVTIANAGVLTVSGDGTVISSTGGQNPILAITGSVPVAHGGTGLTSGTSGGILGFTAPGTLSSSGALSSGGLVLGGGAGATPSTSNDFTTTSATNSAVMKVGKSGTGTPNTGDLGALFLAGSTNGGPTLASQATGGSLTLQLPNTAPSANQVLTASAVSGNNVTLGFTTPATGTVTNVTASSPLASSGGATPNISLTGTVAIANGGTGISTAPGAANQFLRSPGAGSWAVGAIQAGDLPLGTSSTVGAVSAPTCAAGSHYSSILTGTLQCTPDATTTSLSFNSITAGTNTAVLLVGTGGSLNVSGTGTINATSLSGEAAATSATAGTIAARDGTGQLSATQFNGSGAGLTNVPLTSVTGAPVRVTASTTSATKPTTGTTATAVASCAAGRVLLGGGAQVTNTSSPEKSVVTQSFPSTTSAWTAVGVVTQNLGNPDTMTVTAYALCSGS